MTISPSHQHRQPQEGYLGARLNDEFLVQRFRLAVVDEDQDLVLLEGVDGQLELPLPIEEARFLELPAVERHLRLLRLDQSLKDLPLFDIEILHLLINAAPNQLPD